MKVSLYGSHEPTKTATASVPSRASGSLCLGRGIGVGLGEKAIEAIDGSMG
jgi:hypothetical protein